MRFCEEFGYVVGGRGIFRAAKHVNMEEVVMECLKDLVDRSLVIVSKQRHVDVERLFPHFKLLRVVEMRFYVPERSGDEILNVLCVRRSTSRRRLALHPSDDESTTGRQPSPPPPSRLHRTTAQPAGSRLQSRSPAPPSPQPAAADDEYDSPGATAQPPPPDDSPAGSRLQSRSPAPPSPQPAAASTTAAVQAVQPPPPTGLHRHNPATYNEAFGTTPDFVTGISKIS
nr:hypothetical protein Iba_chr09cCG13460 [Ipomoea batatas]